MKVLLFQTLCMPAFARILIIKPKASLLIHLIKRKVKEIPLSSKKKTTPKPKRAAKVLSLGKAKGHRSLVLPGVSLYIDSHK